VALIFRYDDKKLVFNPSTQAFEQAAFNQNDDHFGEITSGVLPLAKNTFT
jgi:hypothetical protein